MAIKRWVAALMVLLFLMAAGCGGTERASDNKGDASPKKTAANQVTDVRTLLTKAEVAEIIGEPVKNPDYKAEASNPMGQQMLYFPTAKEIPVRFIQLSLVQNEGMNANLRSSGYKVKRLYEDTKKNFADNQPIPGIGDEAFWGTDGLHILYGNYYLDISINIGNKEENMELGKKVAAKVLPRL